MNILPALQYYLNQHTPHKWETPTPNTLHTTIHTPILHGTTLITHITIIQENNLLHLTNGLTLGLHEGPCHEQQTIDLLDPHFLHKIHQFITTY